MQNTQPNVPGQSEAGTRLNTYDGYSTSKKTAQGSVANEKKVIPLPNSRLQSKQTYIFKEPTGETQSSGDKKVCPC